MNWIALLVPLFVVLAIAVLVFMTSPRRTKSYKRATGGRSTAGGHSFSSSDYGSSYVAAGTFGTSCSSSDSGSSSSSSDGGGGGGD